MSSPPNRSEVRAEPFRTGPPRSDGDAAVHRARLIERLGERFAFRVTLVEGGPGFGKTTLLAQALAENRIEPRGLDAWLACTAADSDAEHLCRGLLRALETDGPSTADRVVEAVWSRSPDPVALVLDDVHEIAEGSPGAGVLGDLVERLPQNGHLVLAGRSRPPVPLARWRSKGALLEIDEEALAFDAEEARAFARSRGVEVANGSHWPALLALQTATGVDAAAEFVWEEVLAHLPAEQREALARTAFVEWLDDGLVRALVGDGWDVTRLFAGLPLVSRDSDGRGRLHPLWRPFLVALDGADAPEHRRAAARLLRERGRVLEALVLANAIEDEAEREACLHRLALSDHAFYSANELNAALGQLPEARRPTASQLLLDARVRFRADPSRAGDLLEAARAGFEEAGDGAGEIEAIAALARAALWAVDIDGMRALHVHGDRLIAAGHRGAEAFQSQGRAAVSLLQGDSRAVLGWIDRARVAGGGDPYISNMLAALAALQAGDPERALDEVVPLEAGGVPPAMRGTVAMLRSAALWWLGRVGADDAASARVSFSADEVESNHNVALLHAGTALVHALNGEAERARKHLAALAPVRAKGLGDRIDLVATYATAALAIEEGDEAQAADLLQPFVAAGHLEPPLDQYRHRSIAMVYLLVPEARDGIDALEAGPIYRLARELGRALAEAREGRLGPVAAIDWSLASRFRAQLPSALRVELWLAAQAAGIECPEDALPTAARDIVRRLASDAADPIREAARTWLRRVPAPPEEPTVLRVLGPLQLTRADAEVDDAGWRRERVRTLLQLLVCRRRIRREEAAFILWPDKDTESAANNLRVNLTHLLKVLEPARSAAEPSWYLKQEGEWIEWRHALATDAESFERACDEGDAASERSLPSAAIEAYDRAVECYAGDFMEELIDAEWTEAERTRLRMRFIRAAVRSGELHLGIGASERALSRAARVSAIEPLEEGAYRLAVRAYLARGERASARRAAEGARRVIEDAGLELEEETRRLWQQLGLEGATD